MFKYRDALRAAALCLLATFGAAYANAQDTSDPPDRAARLSEFEGAVSLQPAGSDTWIAASLNRPLTSGDQLWSDRDSRVELELGSAAVRVGSSSAIALLNLTDQLAQFRITAGSLSVSVRALDPGSALEIDAPTAVISVLEPGTYRLDIDAAGNTSVVVHSGAAQISGAEQNITLHTQQRGVFTGNGNFVAAVGAAAAPDDFDRWCAQRDQRWAADDSAQYVSSEVVGYEDLEDYGDWQSVPDYGYAWFPSNVAADWAPYQIGDWVWVAPWGWTWVDAAPWGYAPFHYGRWGHSTRGWFWVPAPPRSRAVYAPALVAWVGGARGTVGAGTRVGWFPLAPGEIYVPMAGASLQYVQRVNLSNTRIADPGSVAVLYRSPAQPVRYANRELPSALTAVSGTSFASGRAVTRTRISAPPDTWRTGTASSRAPSIAPMRSSNPGVAVARPPAAIVDRPVLFQRSAPAPSRLPGPPHSPAIVMRPSAPANLMRVNPAPVTTERIPDAAASQPYRAPASTTPPQYERRYIPERSPQLRRSEAVQSPELPSAMVPPRSSESTPAPAQQKEPPAPQPEVRVVPQQSEPKPASAPQPLRRVPTPSTHAENER